MLHSTIPFGQSSTAGLFGSQTVFGQTSRSNTNPFDSSTWSSPFCGTGVFGHSSAPAFNTPAALAAGISSPPAFGFGSTPSQTSPFGSTFPQTQTLYGSNIFLLATPFIPFSQPAFSIVSLLFVPQAPLFLVSQQPQHSDLQLPQCLVPQFSHHLGLQQISHPVLNQHLGCQVPHHLDPQVTSVFGGQGSSAFGFASTPALASHNSASSGSSPVFSASFAPCFGYIPSFGQSMSAVGSNPFGITPAPFGNQSSITGNKNAIPVGSSVFGQSSLGAKQGGSRVTTYAPILEANEVSVEGVMLQMESISAMPVYKDKSHEELRWEDYQHGDRGGVGFAASTQVNPFGGQSASAFGSSSAPAFGAHNTSRSGLSTAAVFSASSAPCFGFGKTPSFGQATSAVDSSPFGITPEPSASQRSTIGNQNAIRVSSADFRQSSFEAKPRGSRMAAYTPTSEADGASVEGVMPPQMVSISAMPVYKHRSHEELRWEDYHHEYRGGPNSAGQAGGVSFAASTQVSPFGSVSSDSLVSKTSSIGSSDFASSPTSDFNSLFDGSRKPVCRSSPFVVSSATVGSGLLFSSANLGNTQSSGLFQSSPSAGQSPSITFGALTVGLSSAFGSSQSLGNIQTSGLLQSSATSVGQTSSPIDSRSISPFSGSTTPAFSSSPSIFGTSMVGSTSAFTSCFAPGNVQTSGLSQASTTSLGKTSPTPSTSDLKFSPLIGSTTPAFSFASSGFGSSSIEAGSGFSSSFTLGNGNTQSTGLFQSFTPSLMQTSSSFGLNSSSPSRITAFSSSHAIFGSSVVGSSSSSGSGLFQFFTPPFMQTSSSFGLNSSSPSRITAFSSSPAIFGSSVIGSSSPSGSGFFQSSPPFMQTSSSFGLNSSSPSRISSSSAIFGSSVVGSSSPSGSFMTHGNPQSSGIVHLSTSSTGQTTSPFGVFHSGKTMSPLSFSFNLSSAHSNSAPSTLSMSNPVVFYHTTPSLSVSSHPASPVQTSTAFPDGGVGGTQPAFCGSGSTASLHGQDTFMQLTPGGSGEAAAATSVENPVDQHATEKDHE